VFHMYVVKVDRNVVYVAMVVHICCKLPFPMYHMFFFSDACCNMLQVFYLDVAYVRNDINYFSCVFASVSYVCFNYFICLQTYVASVASGCFKNRSGVAHVVIRVRSGGTRAVPTRALQELC